jgi:N-acetylglutamate synthase-like GNAT family acetyltransferase
MSRYFTGNMVLQGLAVHPAYWRRGHASTLIQWGLKLADLDQVSIVVSSSANGEVVYEKAGFRKSEGVTIHNKDKKTVYVSFWTTAPKATSS